MRILLDTCAVIDLTTDPDSLSREVLDIFNDPENQLFISPETERELVVQFNNKKLVSRFWDTAEEMLLAIENDYEIEPLRLTSETMHTYASLALNNAQKHKDPSDHVIISHAITEKLTLLSSDEKFPYYRNQGLDLIEY